MTAPADKPAPASPALGPDEIRAIDAEATAVALDLYGNDPSWSAYGCGYKAGVIAERARRVAAPASAPAGELIKELSAALRYTYDCAEAGLRPVVLADGAVPSLLAAAAAAAFVDPAPGLAAALREWRDIRKEMDEHGGSPERAERLYSAEDKADSILAAYEAANPTPERKP